MIPIVSVVVTATLALAGSAFGQDITAKTDWVKNNMKFTVSSPRQAGQTDAEAFVTAMLHGRLRAYGQVLEKLEGVTIKAKGTVNQRRVVDFGTFGRGKSKLPIPGITLKSIKEVKMRDGTIYDLVYQTPLAGRGSLLNSVWSSVKREILADPPEQVSLPPGDPDESEFTPHIKYTGLVLDLQKFQVDPSPVVQVLSEEGLREVYGALRVSTEFVLEQGMVGYGRSLDEPASIRERVGRNPLVVGPVRIENGNPVVSKQDADRILYADKQSGFLAKCQVAFLIGN